MRAWRPLSLGDAANDCPAAPSLASRVCVLRRVVLCFPCVCMRVCGAGTDLVYYDDLKRSKATKLTRGMLKRVFDHFPRHLTSTTPRTLNYDDFVWFFLAEKDRMMDTSIVYWFRCLDVDGDGFLSIGDLEACYSMKARHCT